MWLFFLALHLIGLTGYSLLLRKSLVANVDRWVLATIMQTGIAIPMVFALFIAPPDLSLYTPQIIAVIVVTAALVISLHFSNVKALQHLEVGVYSVLYNLRILFTTILGVAFLGEKIIPLQIAGGLLIFLAVLAVRQKGRRDATNYGIQWGLAAAVVISVLNLSEKSLINDVGYLPYAIPVMLLSAIVMWGILLARRQTIPLATFKQPQTIWLMVLRAVSAYGATLAFYMGGTLSVSTYISSLGVITTVIFGILLLKETDYLEQKLIAAGLAFAGLTLILIANIT